MLKESKFQNSTHNAAETANSKKKSLFHGKSFRSLSVKVWQKFKPNHNSLWQARFSVNQQQSVWIGDHNHEAGKNNDQMITNNPLQ